MRLRSVWQQKSRRLLLPKRDGKIRKVDVNTRVRLCIYLCAETEVDQKGAAFGPESHLVVGHDFSVFGETSIGEFGVSGQSLPTLRNRTLAGTAPIIEQWRMRAKHARRLIISRTKQLKLQITTVKHKIRSYF